MLVFSNIEQTRLLMLFQTFTKTAGRLCQAHSAPGAKWPLTMSFKDHVADLTKKVMLAVRFGDEAAIIGDVGVFHAYTARCDEQEHVRPALVHLMDEIHPVQGPRHLNVREKQLHVLPRFKDA